MALFEKQVQALANWFDKRGEDSVDEREKYKYRNEHHAAQQNQLDYDAERNKLYEMENHPIISSLRGYYGGDSDERAIQNQKDVVDKYSRQHDIYTWNRLNNEFGVGNEKEPTVYAEVWEGLKNGSVDANGNPVNTHAGGSGDPSREEAFYQASIRLDEDPNSKYNYQAYANGDAFTKGGDAYKPYSEQNKKDLQFMYEYYRDTGDEENAKKYQDLLVIANGQATGNKSNSSTGDTGYSSASEDPNVEYDENGDIHPKSESTSADYDIDEMAGEFILGAWGNGQDRIDNLIDAGYTIEDYNKIQQRVNEAYESGRNLHELTDKANQKLHYW